MARIRTIKPEFWGSSDVSRVSREARFLILGLLSMADDDGRFLAAPNAVIGFVFPNDDDITPAKVKRWLNEAAERSEPVHLYEVDGVRYGCFPKWHLHQRLNRYTPSVLPEPDIECIPKQTKGGDF